MIGDQDKKRSKLSLPKRSTINMEPIIEEHVMGKPLCNVNQRNNQSKQEHSKFNPLSPTGIAF